MTFIIEDNTVHRYCADTKSATAIRSEVQSVNGCNFEHDGNFIYAVVSDPDAAREELEADG